MEFKAGDRATVYDSGIGIRTGSIVKAFRDKVEINFGDGTYIFYAKQCRRLKPKEKSVRVTRNRIRGAWNTVIASRFPMQSRPNGTFLDDLCKALGLE